MSVKIEVLNTDKAAKFLNKKGQAIEQATRKALMKSAILMQGEVKQSIAGHRGEPTSVDTGRLLNSVDINVGSKEAMVSSEMPYAKYIEYGTSKIKARKHFTNSAFRNKEKVKETFESEIKQA